MSPSGSLPRPACDQHSEPPALTYIANGGLLNQMSGTAYVASPAEEGAYRTGEAG